MVTNSNIPRTRLIRCHDGSYFCNYMCPKCGLMMHVHEGELPPDHRELELRTFCKKCGAHLALPAPVFGLFSTSYGLAVKI